MERHLYCVIEMFTLRNPKSVSLPTQYCVWEVSVLNQSKLGKTKIKWFLKTRYLKDLDRIDGEPTEFEWITFPGFTTLAILDEVQKMKV